MVITIPRRHVDPSEFPKFNKHVCPPKDPSGSPFDPQVPNRTVRRSLLTGTDIFLKDDGTKVGMWILENPEDRVFGLIFPSPLIRTVQGEIVHGITSGRSGSHTIHWHGIEPSPMNDGVGAQSFELTGNFTYQFATNEAGTYFYHCHKNTPLHFIRGLYGGLVVDPKNRKPDGTKIDTSLGDAPYTAGGPISGLGAGGPGLAAAGSHPNLPIPVQNIDGNLVIKYDKEVLWVNGEMDTRWMNLGTDAFLQKCNIKNPIDAGNFTQDGILNDFRPDIFHVTGNAVRKTSTGWIFNYPLVKVDATVGQTVLIRQITAGFKIQQFTLPVDVVVIAMDGHPLGADTSFHKYNRPFKVPAGTPFRLTSARRWDMIIPPTTPATPPGTFATVEFIDWVTDELLFTGKIPINIT